MAAILSLDRVSAKQILDDHNHGTTPMKFVEDEIVVVLERIGVLWQEGSIALSQVYMGGRICEADFSHGVCPDCYKIYYSAYGI